MKKNLLTKNTFLFYLLLSSSFLNVSKAQLVNFEWANKIEGELEFAVKTIAVDGEGNVYSTGTFTEPSDFDPTEEEFIMAPIGERDVFILKLNSGGGFAWAKQFGGDLIQSGINIDVDESGNIFTSGVFTGIVDFDPEETTYNLANIAGGAFISKLTTEGEFVWAKQIIFNSDVDAFLLCNAMAIDNDGSVYTAGCFSQSFDFDPGLDTFNLQASGIVDNYILKLNNDGDFLWAKNTGGTSDEEILSLSIDQNNNVLSTGYFNFIADFDPGVGVYDLESSSGSDVFISKLNENGDFVWAKSFVGVGGSWTEFGKSITVDQAGNIYTIGILRDSIDLDPGDGAAFLTPDRIGSSGVFISKLNEAGEFVWAKKIDGTGIINGNSIVLDNLNNLFITGGFSDTVDFNPNEGIYNLFSTGVSSYAPSSLFILGLTTNGDFITAVQVESDSGTCQGYSIRADNEGNIITNGTFENTVDFDPGSDEFNLTSNANSSIFLLKLSPSQIIGVNENIGLSKINIYPNPSDGLFNLNLKVGTNATITNIFGKIIMDEKLNTINNTIDLSDQPCGLYFCKIEQNGKYEIVKLIKQN